MSQKRNKYQPDQIKDYGCLQKGFNGTSRSELWRYKSETGSHILVNVIFTLKNVQELTQAAPTPSAIVLHRTGKEKIML